MAREICGLGAATLSAESKGSPVELGTLRDRF
jgi:hypothetical protein